MSLSYVDEREPAETEGLTSQHEHERQDVTDLQQQQAPRLTLTINPAGGQLSGSDEARTQSCINIAVQTEAGVGTTAANHDDECPTCGQFPTGALGSYRWLLKRLAIVGVVIAAIVLIVLLERFFKVEILDEKKLIQDLAAYVVGPIAATLNKNVTMQPKPE